MSADTEPGEQPAYDPARPKAYLDNDDGSEPYDQILDALWTAHLDAPADDAPTVISTFAGGGGSTLGYSAAGYDELAAVDYLDAAVTAYSRNFASPIYDRDLREMDFADFRDELGLAPGDLDVLDGSPPCQGFSTNQSRWGEGRDRDDARNSLFLDFVRAIDAFEPRAVVMENVEGMAQGDMKPICAAVIHELKRAGPGYDVTARRVRFSRLGVPTIRTRLIFIGVRSDLDIEPAHPTPRTAERTIRDAFVDLPDGHADDMKNLVEYGDRYGRLWARIPVGKSADDIIGTGTQTRKADPERPSYTIQSAMTDHGFGSLLHWSEPRAFSQRELARIQSFPDDYWLHDSFRDAATVIGNAVPPLGMYHIARTIDDYVLSNTDAAESGRVSEATTNDD